jgi:hypothetical protein
MTSLEGFECGDADQRKRSSGLVSACPSVTVNPLGSLSNRARNTSGMRGDRKAGPQAGGQRPIGFPISHS